MTTSGQPQTEFDGQCAFAVSTGKMGVPGNERHVITEDGKRYAFSNPVAKLLWRVLPSRRAKAHGCWREQNR